LRQTGGGPRFCRIADEPHGDVLPEAYSGSGQIVQACERSFADWLLSCGIAALLAILWMVDPSLAVEGNTAAGPIGGTDIRSAMLPPPGLYAGAIGLLSPVHDIHDGQGHAVSGLDAVDLIARIAAPFVVYVPDVQVFGGSVGLIATVPMGQECGQLVSFIPRRCISGIGDPYLEAAWSRSFGHLRPSRDHNALPIMEGLTIALGLGVVVPAGKYDSKLQVSNGITIGNNTWDVAPTIAFTYTTPPLLAEGTEFSAKLYWNNYGTNPDTHYQAGSLLDIDFAVTEHIGRFQVGLTGFYAFQIADDRKSGIVVAPDGREIELLNLGGVVNYDLPELGAAIRVKALTTVVARNAVVSQSVVVGFVKKLY
jgi:hypothetical protein